ncbi:hypothetical protein MHYP_G00007800 [Metynnis hypsauchen]
MVQCGHASGGLISQLDSTVKNQSHMEPKDLQSVVFISGTSRCCNIRKRLQFEYLVPALATTNVASILSIILLIHLLRKKRSSVTREVSSASDTKTDEVNYAALTFGNKQRRTVQKRTNVATTVVYGAVRHQEAL